MTSDDWVDATPVVSTSSTYVDWEHTIRHGSYDGHVVPGVFMMIGGLYHMVCILYRHRNGLSIGLPWYPPPGITHRLLVPSELLAITLVIVLQHLYGAENWPGALPSV